MLTNQIMGLLAQSSSSGSGAELIFLLVYFVFIIVMIVGIWKMFSKAGHPGWLAIIPVVNLYIMCKIGGRPGWWLILFFLPIISLIFWIILSNDISKSFGRGIGTTLGLIFIPFVFYPILGFGSAQYQGPGAAAAVVED